MTKTPTYLLTPAERETPAARVREIATELRYYAQQIEDYADKLAETGNIEYMQFAANSLSNAFGTIRLDLLVKYAAQAYLWREIDRHNKAEQAAIVQESEANATA